MLLRLLERADVLIENYKPGAMEKWGLGYRDVLQAALPAPGPLPDQRLRRRRPDGRAARLRRGDPGDGRHVLDQRHARRAGTRIGIPLVDLGTGLYAAIGILMALLERARSGSGQFLD